MHPRGPPIAELRPPSPMEPIDGRGLPAAGEENRRCRQTSQKPGSAARRHPLIRPGRFVRPHQIPPRFVPPIQRLIRRPARNNRRASHTQVREFTVRQIPGRPDLLVDLEGVGTPNLPTSLRTAGNPMAATPSKRTSHRIATRIREAAATAGVNVRVGLPASDIPRKRVQSPGIRSIS